MWLPGFAVLAALLLLLIKGLLTSDFHFGVFLRYLFDKRILIGVMSTLAVGTLALFTGMFLGFFVALARLSSDVILTRISSLYIYIFRGIPMLIQILFWFNAVPILLPNHWSTSKW